jgi:hypothetical protein
MTNILPIIPPHRSLSCSTSSLFFSVFPFFW